MLSGEKEYEKQKKLAIDDLAVGDLGFDLDELAGEPLDFFAREGGRMMLTVALDEEVNEFLGRGRYERKTGGPSAP